MRALRFAAGQRRAVGTIVFLTVGVGVANALEPLLLRAVIDGSGGVTAERRLLLGIVGLALLCLLRETLNALSSWLTWRTRMRVQYAILDSTVDRLHALSVEYHQTKSVGATMARLDRGVQGLVAAFSELAFNLLPSVVFLILAAILMLRLDWRLSIIILILVPLPAAVGVWAAPVQTNRDRRLLDRWSRIYARFNEVLSSIATVKSFAMENAEKQRFMRHVGEANQLVVKGVGFDARVGAAQQMLIGLARVAVIAYGGYAALHGSMTIGTLLAFLGFLGGLFGPVQGLTNLYQTLDRASVSLETVFSILDSPERVTDRPGAETVTTLRGDVSFENVGFGYLAGRPVLTDISFRIHTGQTVALVGPSGGGKTSIASLLQRLYDPDDGIVRIDGVDVRGLVQTSLRRQIGVVSQDPILFNESVRANIAYGRPDADQQAIEEAARAANAHDFIQRLPAGYETEVNDRGSLLSGGQRQRIAIARALLTNPSIVILDEATSGLDAESEALVQEALARLLAGRTTLVIAHRLSTVVRADRILVIHDGRIAEAGTHAELLATGGYYARLVNLQTRGLHRPVAA
jgi:ATP-binding cassette subfamily B protein